MHSGPVEGSSSADSRWLATGGHDDLVRLFPVDDPSVEPLVLAGLVTALGFSPDDRWLAIGSDRGRPALGDGPARTQPVVLGHELESQRFRSAPMRSLATGDRNQ